MWSNIACKSIFGKSSRACDSEELEAAPPPNGEGLGGLLGCQGFRKRIQHWYVSPFILTVL